MTAPTGHHDDVAGYALGRLNPAECARFEAHLEGCPACRDELAELREAADLLALAPPAAAPPADLEARTLAAVRRAAAEDGPRPAPSRSKSAPRWPAWAPRAAAAALAAAAVAGAFLLGGRALDDGRGGTREISAVLRAPGGGGATASVEVTRTGIGRVVELSSDDLPILPKGELYEVWFVGPDDRPGARQRISAGTFHPDEDGRSDVALAAAVDPALFPTIVVTAEPGDGDPAPGREVLRWSAP
jgi:Anti-sigma-K factor rskA/Putative zinc-finger